MDIKSILVGRGQTNCYFIWDTDKNTVIVDPGDTAKMLMRSIKRNELVPKLIILTHYHYDHILAVEELKKEYNIPVYIHENGIKGLKDAMINLSEFRPCNTTSIDADKGLVDGEIVKVGELELEIIYTPGHTSSDICIKIENTLITGDTLFHNSVGRSDFQESSYENLKNSILTKLLPLSDDLVVCPGHGEESTLGFERQFNPKVKDMLEQS